MAHRQEIELIGPSPSGIRFSRNTSLFSGTLIQRYKRFLADIRLDSGETIIAHCVNTGRMEGLTRPGLRVWVSPAQNPERKLRYTWELTEVEGEIIGTNTGFPNGFVRYCLQHRLLSVLPAYTEFRPEVVLGPGHRVDFSLQLSTGKTLHLEVKNCHLIYPDRVAYFPDSVSERAARHMESLAELISPEVEVGVLWVCQIPKVAAVKPSDAHDPAFAKAARAAVSQGLQTFALSLTQTPEEILLTQPVSVEMAPYPLEPVLAWKKHNELHKNTPI